VRILLDSHVALWWLASEPSLGEDCRSLVLTADEVFFSAVTPWELGIKRALGKIDYPDGLVAALEDAGFVELAVRATHAEHAAALPPHQGDPFDRMLIAQAQLESLVLATADGSLGAYDISLLDARR